MENVPPFEHCQETNRSFGETEFSTGVWRVSVRRGASGGSTRGAVGGWVNGGTDAVAVRSVSGGRGMRWNEIGCLRGGRRRSGMLRLPLMVNEIPNRSKLRGI